MEYLARNYADGSVKFAIAGRNEKKLQEVVDKVKSLVSSWDGKVTIIKCDTENLSEVHRMVTSTRVVATTAGPFAKIGTPIVAACAYCGTDYCDITGETQWVRENVGLFGKQARSSGSIIVSMCGHDSVP